MDEKLKPVTPGELLLEEFLLPMGITQYRLAKEIGVPAQRIGEIVAGRRAITADTDLRLCRSSVSPTATGCAPRRPTTPRSPRRRWPISSLTSGRGQGPRPEGGQVCPYKRIKLARRSLDGVIRYRRDRGSSSAR